MTLYIIGTGLGDAKDITLKGLELVKKSRWAYLENYTSTLHCNKEALEKAWGKTLILADRDMVEKGCEEMLAQAAKHDVAFLVVGDPLSATTHMDLYIRAKKKGIDVDVVNNASILTAVGIAGLELYKYGKTTSIVFPQEGWNVETYYDVVTQNKKQGLHTLCLLDIKIKEPGKKELLKETPKGYENPRFMTVNEAIQCLLDIEKKKKKKAFTGQTICVGCARLGSPDFKIKAGKAEDMLKEDFGGPLHCLIVPGKLHFMEEEALSLWK